uniref:uncharacterized protein LOC105353095 n=1 Tax=Fragaria vesca subsp. vesca TaxID=101020 RepID=UPI0005CB37F7|nr:PREDICTED: uncharacterized protein LOC105353095 [Fragaria vesca subsp. vesca]XP_011470047.1 PREDICTED: uncharacterized protein LOC105353095 [Fragaria vesca subsp. vesca]XP_011470048.1 PREDICTED: uncharacterized protein LOC105353095 [Fragaria vesca subsp. vesca]
MPNSDHERRFCLSWDTDHSGTCWRWNSTYTDCSYFGYDELGNKVNAKTLINKCSISRRRAYNQRGAYMETVGDKRLKLTDMPLTHPKYYQQGYAGCPSLTIQQNQPEPMQRDGGCGAGYVNQPPYQQLQTQGKEKELYLCFEEVSFPTSCYVLRTIKLSELLACSCNFSTETCTITKCRNCTPKTKQEHQLRLRAWLFTGEKVPPSCGLVERIPESMSCCAYGSQMFLTGGVVPPPDADTANYVPSGDVYSFKPESTIWQKVDWSCPKVKPNPLLFEVNGKLYCLAACGSLGVTSSGGCLVLPDPIANVPRLKSWLGLANYITFDKLACAVVGSKILISFLEPYLCDLPIICFDVNDKEKEWRVMTSLFNGKPFPFVGRALVLDLKGTHVMFSFCNQRYICVSQLALNDDGDISISQEKCFMVLGLVDTLMKYTDPLSYNFVDLGDQCVALVLCGNISSYGEDYGHFLGKVRVVVVVIHYEVLSSNCITSNIKATRTFEYNCHSSDILLTHLTGGFVV